MERVDLGLLPLLVLAGARAEATLPKVFHGLSREPSEYGSRLREREQAERGGVQVRDSPFSIAKRGLPFRAVCWLHRSELLTL